MLDSNKKHDRPNNMVLNWQPLTEQISLTTHKCNYDDNDHTNKMWIAEIPLILNTLLSMLHTVKTKNMNSLHVKEKCQFSMMRRKSEDSYFILRARVKAVKPYWVN